MGNKLLMTDRQIFTANQGGFLCLKDWQVMRVFFSKCTKFLTGTKKELRKLHKLLNLLVPRAGVEPARPYERGILSPLRLPISPPRHRLRW